MGKKRGKLKECGFGKNLAGGDIRKKGRHFFFYPTRTRTLLVQKRGEMVGWGEKSEVER